jgi:hypothetical protein
LDQEESSSILRKAISKRVYVANGEQISSEEKNKLKKRKAEAKQIKENR